MEFHFRSRFSVSVKDFTFRRSLHIQRRTAAAYRGLCFGKFCNPGKVRCLILPLKYMPQATQRRLTFSSLPEMNREFQLFYLLYLYPKT